MNALALVIPTFIAGILTFLAPCTLPLVPGYLGFISGTSLDDLKDPLKAKKVRWKIFINGVFFIIGFSIIFIIFGTLIGLVGAALIPFRLWLTRIAGIFVIFFGLFMLGVFQLPFLQVTKRFKAPSFIQRGKPISSMLLGLSFGVGWTPCVGPILGSVLLLASTSGTALQGAVLLAVFSAGLAIPFLLVALGIGSAAQKIKQFSKYLKWVSIVGGVFLIGLGLLLFFNKLALLLTWGFQLFGFLNYDAIIQFL